LSLSKQTRDLVNMLWNDLDDSSRSNTGLAPDSELGSSRLYQKIYGNTTHALHVPELSMFESFVKETNKSTSDSLFTSTVAHSRTDQDKTRLSTFTQAGDNSEMRAKYMRYFQPSLDSELYRDTQTTSMAEPQEESHLSLDVELPSELFSQVNEQDSHRVFRLFGEVIATKPSRPKNAKQVRLQSPERLSVVSPPPSPLTPSRIKLSVQDDDSYLKDLSTNLKQILENPFKLNEPNRTNTSVQLPQPSNTSHFQPITNLTGIGQFSPIKLVEYSSSESEETFAKPKVPARKFKPKVTDHFDSQMDNVTCVNQSKLQSTFMDRNQSTKVDFNTPAKPAMSPEAKVSNDKDVDPLEILKKPSKSLSVESFVQPEMIKQTPRSDYNILVDRQRLHLIHLKKELLRVQRLERLFAKLTTQSEDANVPDKPKPNSCLVNDQQLKDKLREEARHQIELSVNRKIMKVVQNSPNLSNLPPSVLNPYRGKENRLQSSLSMQSLPSNSSFIDVDNTSCTSSKASYELSEACSRIKSILNDSSDFVLDSSIRPHSPAKLNETFVKSTFCFPNSAPSSPIKACSQDHTKRTSTNRTEIDGETSKVLVKPSSPVLESKRINMDYGVDNFKLPNTLSLEQMFRQNRPRLYEKIVQRSVQLTLDSEKRRQVQELQSNRQIEKSSHHRKSRQSLLTKAESTPCLLEAKNRPKPDMKQVRQQTAQKYSQLPEVQRRRKERERQEQIRTNRVMAQAYNAKLMDQMHRRQQHQKQSDLLKSQSPPSKTLFLRNRSLAKSVDSVHN
jgi:hypothetical protein